MFDDTVIYGFDYIMYYISVLYYKYMGFPLVIRICVFVVIACSVIYVVVALYIMWGIYQRKKERQRYERLHKRYYVDIEDIVLDERNWTIEEVTNKLNSSNKRLKPYEARVITQLLIETKVMAGEAMNESNSHVIATVFNLPLFYERGLQFGRVNSKVKILKSIQALNEYISEAVLVRLLHHSKIGLRKAARICYMWLSRNAPFRFFDESTNISIDIWDMVEFHSVFRHRQESGYVMPNFLRWLDHAVDEGVKIFLIREIAYFNQVENCPALLKQFNTPNINLRNEIVRSLGLMKYTEAEALFIESYSVQPEIVKRSILESVVHMNTGNAVNFLREAYESADDMATKQVAVEGLYKYGKAGQDIFYSLEAKAEGFSALLLAHVKDPLINRH